MTVLSIHNKAYLPINDISALGALTQITNLYLYGIGFIDVSALANLTRLEELALCGGGITDVSALSKLTQLKELSLEYNRLTDVSSLSKLTQLKELNLHQNLLTDVSPLGKLKQLEILRLSNNKLTDISDLSKLTQLKFLELRGNPGITKAKISKLQKVLPKCNINLMGGRTAKQNSDPKSGVGNSWTGYEIAENVRYIFKLKRVDGPLFIGSFTAADYPNFLVQSRFWLVSIQEFRQLDLKIVTFERDLGHIYRAILTKDGTKMIYGTRGGILGNTEENPELRRTKWALELEKTKD